MGCMHASMCIPVQGVGCIEYVPTLLILVLATSELVKNDGLLDLQIILC